ncbi:Os12g0133300 [Oryza sativa Japonica Group]|uniref:Os12g0133300 protein n=1 Tax=Oryza sativa subsp. japonica TaxID=39947 RepID=Q0IQA9_ORYSJ|nr:Os12g0133300 [Oryza sativa Japonica Group]|eukprot:NP_001066087.1 Os12g0133300 [Oryza sativa Japonica Group]
MAAGDAATPLLEMAYQYHEGCPACAVERSKALNPGIPYMRFFHIWIIILVSCLPISSLFPFLYFMVSTSWAIGLIVGPAISGYLAQIFSLWSESDKQFGGLNFSSEDVGQVLAITGASILIYQTFIYPHIVKVLGIINTSRVAVILSMALLCSYPPMTYLSRPWLSIVVNIASMLKNNFVVFLGTKTPTCVFLSRFIVRSCNRCSSVGLRSSRTPRSTLE